MIKLLRAAVIGAGSMGRNHTRVYTEMEDVELVAIADPDQDALSKLAQRQHVRTYTSYQTMLRARADRPGLGGGADRVPLHRGPRHAAGAASRP